MPAKPASQSPESPRSRAPRPAVPPPRIRIEDVRPRLDCGASAVKRTVGSTVAVSALVFADGHDTVRAELRYRPVGKGARWHRAPLASLPHDPDRYAGAFTADECGTWEFTVGAWIDAAATWRDELRRKVEAGQPDFAAELAEGAHLFGIEVPDAAAGLATTREVKRSPARPSRPLRVEVDSPLATFGAWYELFPRSFGGFRGVERVLPVLADAGFDVVYLPPIHPIGRTNRKGRNNALEADADDPGSPWAIGSDEGGHTEVHPDLGTIDDFDHLVGRAHALGLEIALDFAVQCSVDHPWLREHPEWFAWRPDGSVKYAENPPKRYQDIVNVRFDSEHWQELWRALLEVVQFWIAHGVRVFRVDNPHTKPLAFWEWLLAEVRHDRPDVVFLAEAFTRPAVMHALAKVGFNQSYTYFTWRNTRTELQDYVTELAGERAEYFRPNFFVNTPDILHEYLQLGGRPAFEARLVLAATLSPSYGMYSGFERCEATPLRPGSEEYLDSEKYAVRAGEVGGALFPLAARLNEIRRAHPVFRDLRAVTFLETANEQLLAYARGSGTDTVIVCVNLDPVASTEGVAEVVDALDLPSQFPVTDLLTGERYEWASGRNYVRLPPGGAHVLEVS